MLSSIFKVFSREHHAPAPAPARPAAAVARRAYVVFHEVKDQIEAVTGLSVGAFLRECEAHAVAMPGMVQCPTLRNVTLWLQEQGYEYADVLQMPLRDVRDRAVNLEVEASRVFTEPLRAFALWIGKPVIIMVSVGRSVRVVAVREYSRIDNLLPSPEYFVRSARLQGVEIDDATLLEWFGAWRSNDAREDGAADADEAGWSETYEFAPADAIVERETYEYVARVITRKGPELHRWRLRELPMTARADLQAMLSHLDQVLESARGVCVGLGGTLYLVKHENPKALPEREWEIEPVIAGSVD
jgi:hypothetical protein